MIKRRTALGILFVLAGLVIFYWLNWFFLRNVRSSLVNTHDEIGKYRLDIEEISGIIIPESDVPGAMRAGISSYIVNVIENCLARRDKQTVLIGLENLQKYTKRKYSLYFRECTMERKITVLEHFQRKGSFDNSFISKVKNKIWGPSFFELIKELTVMGYCTSKIGATQGLAYEHIPITYKACMPLLPNQRSWATA